MGNKVVQLRTELQPPRQDDKVERVECEMRRMLRRATDRKFRKDLTEIAIRATGAAIAIIIWESGQLFYQYFG
jgi:hypothetical protein